MRNIGVREADMLMRKIGETYQSAKIYLESSKYNGEDICSFELYNSNRYIQCINYYIYQCDRMNQIFLRKQYMEPSDEFWYLQYYSANSYQSVKKRALNDIMSCLQKGKMLKFD